MAGQASAGVFGALAARLSDLAVLTRPRLNSLTVFAVGAGWWAGRAPGSITAGDLRPLLATVVGAALVGGGSSALNQVLERRLDAKMVRTRDRPLPTGRISPLEATAFGLLLTLSGLIILLASASPLAAGLALACVLTYVVVYTPLKTRTSLNTIVGTFPGALPPVMGVAAATGELGPAALFLFALLTVWQLPHFLSIAWLWRDDYERAGMAMLPVVTGGDGTTGRQALIQCVLVVVVSASAYVTGLAGPIYLVTALVAGAGFTWAAARFALLGTDPAARILMRVSVIHLPIVLVAFALDRL